MSAPTLTSDDVRVAFDEWWQAGGYPEPNAETLNVGPASAAIAWDAYHQRMGIAWNAFQAGLRLGLKGNGSGS